MPTEDSKQLHLAYWFSSHRELLRKILIYFLIVVNVSLFVYSFIGLIFIIKEKEALNQALDHLTNTQFNITSLHQNQAPQNLQIGQTTALYNQNNQTTDFIAPISNPNSDWVATNIKYYFLPEHEVESFILPLEDKFLIQLGLAGQYSTQPPIITSITWRRLIENFKLPEIEFTITDIAFNSQIENNLQIARLTANVTNQSIHNFWSVPFICLLYSGSKITAANYVTLDQFQSLETRELNASWYGQNFAYNNIIIQPDLNVFIKDNYWQPASGSGELK